MLLPFPPFTNIDFLSAIQQLPFSPNLPSVSSVVILSEDAPKGRASESKDLLLLIH